MNFKAALAREVNRRVDEALLAAAVKARAFEAVGVGRHVLQRRGDAVGELNFTADAGLQTGEMARWSKMSASKT